MVPARGLWTLLWAAVWTFSTSRGRRGVRGGQAGGPERGGLGPVWGQKWRKSRCQRSGSENQAGWAGKSDG